MKIRKLELNSYHMNMLEKGEELKFSFDDIVLKVRTKRVKVRWKDTVVLSKSMSG